LKKEKFKIPKKNRGWGVARENLIKQVQTDKIERGGGGLGAMKEKKTNWGTERLPFDGADKTCVCVVNGGVGERR